MLRRGAPRPGLHHAVERFPKSSDELRISDSAGAGESTKGLISISTQPDFYRGRRKAHQCTDGDLQFVSRRPTSGRGETCWRIKTLVGEAPNVMSINDTKGYACTSSVWSTSSPATSPKRGDPGATNKFAPRITMLRRPRRAETSEEEKQAALSSNEENSEESFTRLWRKFRRSDTTLRGTKSNEDVYAKIRLQQNQEPTLLACLDTGAGPNFINESVFACRDTGKT